MDRIPKNDILEFHPHTLEAVRQDLGLDAPGAMKEAIDNLEEWIKMQHHFKKKDFSRHYLETAIVSVKGCVEKAKRKMERASQLKTSQPQFFGDFNINTDFKELDGCAYQVILPKLTKQYHRVIFFKVFGTNFRNDFTLLCCRITFMLMEYLRANDYNNGYVMVLDYLDCPNLLRLASKFSIFELRQATHILMECYGARLKGVHFLTTSTLISVLLSIGKRLVSAKLGRRFHVHKDLDSLHRVVENEVLPVEYGGQERSFHILRDEWKNLLSTDEFREYRREMNKATIDESLR